MAFLLKLCSVQRNSKVVRYTRKQESLDNSQTDFPLGAIHKQRQQLRGGGSKMGRKLSKDSKYMREMVPKIKKMPTLFMGFGAAGNCKGVHCFRNKCRILAQPNLPKNGIIQVSA